VRCVLRAKNAFVAQGCGPDPTGKLTHYPDPLPGFGGRKGVGKKSGSKSEAEGRKGREEGKSTGQPPANILAKTLLCKLRLC